MELGTFGAIFRFAIELEQQTVVFYEAAAQGTLEEPFEELALGSRNRPKRLEQARREGVAEMILESIEGLDSSSYNVDLTPRADTSQRLHQAIALEGATGRFYREAAAKMPIQEIVRLFQQLAEENAHRQAQLAGLHSLDLEIKGGPT